jgi:hypothetical protein
MTTRLIGIPLAPNFLVREVDLLKHERPRTRFWIRSLVSMHLFAAPACDLGEDPGEEELSTSEDTSGGSDSIEDASDTDPLVDTSAAEEPSPSIDNLSVHLETALCVPKPDYGQPLSRTEGERPPTTPPRPCPPPKPQ